MKLIKGLTKNEYQRQYRAATSNECTLKYEKSKKGFLMRAYRNMLSRVSGVQHKKSHLYAGLPILEKEAFYAWADSAEFHSMFEAWQSSGYNRKLTPSVDRIDSSLGYVLSNMRWLTHSANSRNGNRSRWSNGMVKHASV